MSNSNRHRHHHRHLRHLHPLHHHNRAVKIDSVYRCLQLYNIYKIIQKIDK